MSASSICACICEGNAERAIINLLLENNALIFSKDDLLGGEIIKKRDAHSFEEDYLNASINKKIKVYRILDSRKEAFKLRKVYERKVEVINVITAPEIEMLIIIAEGKVNDFRKRNMKPSEYCKNVLRLGSVKNAEFIKEYFHDFELLKFSLYEYKRITHKAHQKEMTIADLLKEDHV